MNQLYRSNNANNALDIANASNVPIGPTRPTLAQGTKISVLFSLLVGLLIGSAHLTPAVAQTQNPNMRIISPASATSMRGTITVIGSANPAGFGRYELSYATEPDAATWTVVGAAIQPVDGGTLGAWNTRPLPDGSYALRLQVFSTDNQLLGESVVRNITLTNQANAAADTSAPAGEAATTTNITESTGRSTAESALSAVSAVPRYFLRGMTYVMYVFIAIAVYIALKHLVAFLWKRYRQEPVDYGQ